MPRPIGEPMDMSQTPVARHVQEETRAGVQRAERRETAEPDGRAGSIQQARIEPRPQTAETTRPAAIFEIDQPVPRVRDEQPDTPTPQPVNPARGSINLTA